MFRLFYTAIKANGISEKVTMDQTSSNKVVIDQINDSMPVPMIIRQIKYFNNIVEQDHRAVKIITKPMFGFKSFKASKSFLAGIEIMHMIRNG